LAVILKPASGGEDLAINWWNWRPAVALLVRAAVVPPGEREDRCLANGAGGHLSEAEACAAAEYMEGLLARMRTTERLMLDGSMTDRPIKWDVPVSEWDQQEINERYSATYDVLKMIAEFCRRSGGFEVV
jgi:hypothetical protein